ncbi:dual specificity protein phosphatase 14 isoform X5 [Manis pentadactyla]|uniref:dual specificity protein phosphatase 14 isoform X5 n=1 Tax=Manis pentadactyla TaxID=143292 RepID=UPI00255C96B2|nr:dual specificity protein phosphatase 14 isoform X5 [Manis pentadactyla]
MPGDVNPKRDGGNLNLKKTLSVTAQKSSTNVTFVHPTAPPESHVFLPLTLAHPESTRVHYLCTPAPNPACRNLEPSRRTDLQPHLCRADLICIHCDQHSHLGLS